MPRFISARMQEKLNRANAVWAYCTRVTRTDGRVLRFTSWPYSITFNGERFEPQDSVNAAALGAKEGVSLQETEVSGVLSSEKITEEDLYAGRFRGARVYQFRVDPYDPSAGELTPISFIIGEVEFDYEVWRAELQSSLYALDRAIGNVISKQCSAVFGGPRCRRDLGDVTYTDVLVATVTDARKEFRAQLSDIPGGLANDTFRHGVIEWTFGANLGERSPVRSYQDVDRRFVLMRKTKFDISVGDTFTVIAGCDHTVAACTSYGNLLNFQGEPDVPGPDRILEKT